MFVSMNLAGIHKNKVCLREPPLKIAHLRLNENALVQTQSLCAVVILLRAVKHDFNEE